MRVLVYKAEARLAQSLVNRVSSKANLADQPALSSERERSFDMLIQLGHSDMVKQDNALMQSSIQICKDRLARAIANENPGELKWAMATTVRAALYPSPELEEPIDNAAKAYQKLANLPPEWNVKQMITGLVEGRMLSKTKIDDEGFKSRMQSLLDSCSKKVYTRDRKGDMVPQ